jgi:hypothetical protein
MTLSSRDPIVVTEAAKRLVQAGQWRTLPGRDDKSKILLALKSRLPFALTTGPHIDALVALGKELDPSRPMCHWCAAAVVRTPKPELPRNEINRVALGTPCTDCEARWEQAEVEAREAAHIGQLVAAGFRPEAAKNLRTPEQVTDYTRQLRWLETAKLPPRPQPSATPTLPPFYGSRRVQPTRSHSRA